MSLIRPSVNVHKGVGAKKWKFVKIDTWCIWELRGLEDNNGGYRLIRKH